VGRGREEVRRVEVVCKACGEEYTGEVVMASRAVPGVMGPIGEAMKKVVDNCPKCGSYAVRPKRA
jgi:uncharacterized Zn finger protein